MPLAFRRYADAAVEEFPLPSWTRGKFAVYGNDYPAEQAVSFLGRKRSTMSTRFQHLFTPFQLRDDNGKAQFAVLALYECSSCGCESKAPNLETSTDSSGGPRKMTTATGGTF